MRKFTTFEDYLKQNEKQNATLTIDNSSYRELHEASPSGRGAWTFSVNKVHDYSIHDPKDLFQGQGTFNNVKEKAKEYFKNRGYSGKIYTQG